jgi:RND family efflux transporter MFP subunit
MRKLITGICLLAILITGLSFSGCASEATTVDDSTSTALISRGDLTITVSSDGNLVMPEAFDLKFGAPGNVEDVFVEEGDFVQEGKILATLDSSSQQLDIKSANCSLQQTLSNLYETIPSIQVTYNYPSFYPNASATMASDWAEAEIAEACDLYTSDRKDEAVSKLSLAVSDLESCAAIFQDSIENPQLGWDFGKLEGVDELLAQTYFYNYGNSLVLQWQDIIAQIHTCQENIGKLQAAIPEGSDVSNTAAFKKLSKEIDDIDRIVGDNVNRIRIQPDDMDYPSIDLGLYLYRIAEEKLDEALQLVEQGKANSAEYNDCLITARHCMEMSNSILGTSNLVLEHGLSTKNQQQYNIDVEKLVVTLDDRRDTLLKTIIVAPFDGTVVSVGVKKNDILSAMDYSSKTAVQLVDTRDVRFEGKVDEIDILDVHTGQKAMITVDAVPDRTFTGTVAFISPYGAAESSNVVKFDITVKLDPGDIELKGGLTATADIMVYTAENVVLVPLSAVNFVGEGATVNVISGVDGQVAERQVTLGQQNFQYAEVLAGLEEGEVVQIMEKTIALPVLTTMPSGPPPGR